MNSFRHLAAGLIVLGAVTLSQAQDTGAAAPKPAAPAPAAAPATKAAAPATPAPASAAQAPSPYTDAQLLEELGWAVGKNIQITQLGLSQENLGYFIKGFSSAALSKQSPYDFKGTQAYMQAFIQRLTRAGQTQAFEQARISGAKNLADSNAYFAKLKAENKALTVLPDGLCYEIIQAGTGDYPKASDTVRVQYTGKLLDGTVFDASVRHDPSGIEFPLGGVIPGWTEGIQKINVGGKIRLHIPPQLAYGPRGNQGIPPNSALVFDVELLAIKAGGAAPAAPTVTVQPAPAHTGN